jgi:hypothetical protein
MEHESRIAYFTLAQNRPVLQANCAWLTDKERHEGQGMLQGGVRDKMQ